VTLPSLDILRQLKIARYLAIYEAGSAGVRLPDFKGATFRGSFGHALRQASCACGVRAAVHHDACVYKYLFEMKAGDDGIKRQGFEDVPRPFLICPPADKRNEYGPGERICLSFTLFGRACGFLPMFVYALDLLGRNGIGAGRNPVMLRQVFALDEDGDLAEQVYSWKTGQVTRGTYTLDIAALHNRGMEAYAASGLKQVVMHCETPLRLKHRGELVKIPLFSAIVETAVRRFYSLLRFHHDGAEEVPMPPAIREEPAELVANRTAWESWERYSSRQRARIPAGGLVGQAVYAGDLAPYAGLLPLIECVHLGKNTTFGLGKVTFRFI